jgi:S-adenosylmethionine decarboxylase
MSHTVRASNAGEWRDLAPTILRQRVVIEGRRDSPVMGDVVVEYLRQLSDVCGMTALIDPVAHYSERYGWAGWVHWETSGAHVYAWDLPEPFFSVDIYTCKWFDPAAAACFTQSFLGAREVVWREV